MSQYYVPSRQQSHRRASTSPSTSSGDHHWRSQEGSLLADENYSRYIFPNPSSSNDPALVSSPSYSHSSVFSAPTDGELYYSTTCSGVIASPSRSGDERSDESYVDLNISLDARRLYDFHGAGDTDEAWDWYGETAPVEDALSEDSSGAEFEPVHGRWNVVDRVSGPAVPAVPSRLLQPRLHPLMPRARRFSDYVRSRTHSRSTAVSMSTTSFRSTPDDQNPSTPHPRVRIPLLSLIASLFAVDESTLHLLTHSTTHHGSVLFPGHTLAEPLSLSESPTDVENASEIGKNENEIHGFHKLLLSSDISSDSWKSLKKGLAMVYSNTAPVPSIGIVKLWGLVNQVWVRGGQTLKMVY
jgi:hypothetical protein